MNGLLLVALVCAASVAPADCTRETALDVATRPIAMPTECGMAGQLIGAEALGVSRAAGTYLKLTCERRKV